MTTLETNVVFHDGLVMYRLKKRKTEEITPQQKITGNFYLKVDKNAWILLNINNQEIFIDKPELEISMVDYLKITNLIIVTNRLMVS